MTASIDMINPNQPKRILMVVANAAASERTGWPIGFWWAELTHPYWEFTENGYDVDIVSPKGGDLQADSWSDPRDESGYSADDLISLGFINSETHMAKVHGTRSIADVSIDDYDAVFVAGGQSPMYTMIDNDELHHFFAEFYEAGKVAAAVCHGTCILLKAKLSDGSLLTKGKTWTGFANSEEQYADEHVGQKIQPFWIEDEARKIEGTNFVVQSAFKPFAVRDGRLITGQQQYSGAATARLVIEALGR